MMKSRLVAVVFAVIVISIVVMVIVRMAKLEKSLVIPEPNLKDHPIYSQYDFVPVENVINFGIQPFNTPAGQITETMKRDLILRDALAEIGMEIRFYEFLQDDEINFFLKQGKLHAGVGGDLPAIIAAATFGVVIPSLIQHGFTSIVAGHSMRLRELKGKRVGYAFGSHDYYALVKALESDGLSEKDVNLIPVKAFRMPEALSKGAIDAFAACEPIPTITVMNYRGSTVIHRILSSGYLYFSHSFSEKHPKAMHQIVAAEIRALRWLRKDRENLLEASRWALMATEKLSGHDAGISVEQNAYLAMEDLLGLTSVPFIPINDLAPNGSLPRQHEFLRAKEKIPSSSEWDTIQGSFDRQIINDLLLNQKKYHLDEFKYSGVDGGERDTENER